MSYEAKSTIEHFVTKRRWDTKTFFKPFQCRQCSSKALLRFTSEAVNNVDDLKEKSTWLKSPQLERNCSTNQDSLTCKIC